MNRSIISNVIQGQASAAEQERVNTWLAENINHQQEFDDLCILLQPAADPMPEWAGGYRLIKSIHHRSYLRQRRQRLTAILLLVLTFSMIGIFYHIRKDDVPIQFENALMSDVSQELKTRFNITLIVPSPLQQQRWSGAFLHPSPDEAVALLAASLHTTYHRSGETFTLSPQP